MKIIRKGELCTMNEEFEQAKLALENANDVSGCKK